MRKADVDRRSRERGWRGRVAGGGTWSGSTRSTPAPAMTARPASATASGGRSSTPRRRLWRGRRDSTARIGLARVVHRGLVRPRPPAIDATLARIQNDLFDLGADLCVPGPRNATKADSAPLRDRAEPGRMAGARDRRSSTPICRRCARSCCPAARRPPPRCIWRARSAGAPSAPSSRSPPRGRAGRRAGARLYQPAVRLSVRRRALRQRSRRRPTCYGFPAPTART